MKKNVFTIALATLALPSIALAEETAAPTPLTFNIGIVSNYVYRGISQTSHQPALQGGVDFNHSSGFYAGLWGSNVNWIANSGAIRQGNTKIELDAYFGLKNTFAEDFNYDVGYIAYNYLGSYTPAAGYAKADTQEIYGSLGYKWLTAKYSYGLGQFLTVPGARGTNYIELNANAPISDSGFNLIAHVGKQTYKGTSAAAWTAAGFNPTYSDYKIGITKDINGYVLGLAYSKTNASPFYTYAAHGGNWGKGIAAVSLTHAF